MKKRLVVALTVVMALIGVQAQAWVSTTPSEKSYTFKFKLKNESYEVTSRAATYEEAFDRAAQDCFQYFRGGRHISEDQGLDIIDVCANPRST